MHILLLFVIVFVVAAATGDDVVVVVVSSSAWQFKKQLTHISRQFFNNAFLACASFLLFVAPVFQLFLFFSVNRLAAPGRHFYFLGSQRQIRSSGCCCCCYYVDAGARFNVAAVLAKNEKLLCFFVLAGWLAVLARILLLPLWPDDKDNNDDDDAALNLVSISKQLIIFCTHFPPQIVIAFERMTERERARKTERGTLVLASSFASQLSSNCRRLDKFMRR